MKEFHRDLLFVGISFFILAYKKAFFHRNKLEKSLKNSTILIFLLLHGVLLFTVLFAPVFLGRHSHDLLKATVEGADGIVAHRIRDLGDEGVAAFEHFAGAADAQGVDIIVEAGMELAVE